MRFNDRELISFAANFEGRDCEGYLQKRGETNTAFRQRWFVLKANLLFYYKSPTDAAPIGFVFLEGSRVQVAPASDVAWAFTIQFLSGSREYYLIAKDRYARAFAASLRVH